MSVPAASDGWSVIARRKRPFSATTTGLKAATSTQETPLKTAAAVREDTDKFRTPPPQKKPTTTWSKSFSQTVIKMAADEASHRAATEQAERERRYEAELRDYIRRTLPSRSQFIEPLDDYYSSDSDGESDVYTPPAEEDDEKPVDYLHYGSRRTFADA